jgi:hypothetical protein
MLKQILLSEESPTRLVTAITQGSLEDIIRIWSGIIRLWLECIQLQVHNESTFGSWSSSHAIHQINAWEDRLVPETSVEVDENLFLREKTQLFQKVSNSDVALYNIIRFAIDTARTSPTLCCGMLEAGALSLVIVAFINEDFQPSDLINVATRKGKQNEMKSRGTANADDQYHTASPIPLDIICAAGSTLSALMQINAFRQSWGGNKFNVRRYRCSLLVDILLNSWELDERYTGTWAIFRMIAS